MGRYDGLKQINDEAVRQILRVPERLPSRRRLVAQVLGVQVAGTASALLYLGLTWWSAGLDPTQFPYAPVALLSLGMFVAMALSAGRITAPLARLERALDAGRTVAELPHEDLRATLIHHRPLTTATMAIWGAGWLAFAAGAVLDGQWSRDLLELLGALGLSFTVLMPVFVRYVSLAWHGIGVTGVLLPDGVLDHLGPLPLERVFRHVITLYGVLGVVMPLCLVIVARSPHASFPLLLHTVGDFAVVGYFVAFSVMRLLSVPVGYLESRMAEVEGGDLGVRARVMSADSFGLLVTHFNRMVEGLRQRERIREIFGRYVTRQVAEEILSGRVPLGGERRTATVLFADIQGFTPLAESMPPEEVVALLNEVLGGMVRCVLDEGGVLDKFIGDAIMALFGVPLSAGSPEADAEAAVRCALEMSATLDAINARRRQLGLPEVALGIGVHTGELVAGNIGIPERMEYTVIGDTVNLCSRLEGLTRTLPHRILVSAATAALLPHWSFAEVQTVQVRGRSAPVTVFTPAP